MAPTYASYDAALVEFQSDAPQGQLQGGELFGLPEGLAASALERLDPSESPCCAINA